MSAKQKIKKNLDEIKDLVDDAKDFADALKELFAEDPDKKLTSSQQSVLKRLLKRAESAVEASKELARIQRDNEITQIGKRIENLEFAATLDLPAANRQKVRTRLRRLRSRRARLVSSRLGDFDGLLTKHEVDELKDLMAAAKREVAKKRKLAQVIDTVFKLTDIGLTVIGKVGSLAV